MAYIARVMPAEPWNAWNLIGAGVLVLVGVALTYLIARRR
jgi:hypothetical protein